MKTSPHEPFCKQARRLVPALAACCLLLTLSACGQRGPLFLPDEEPQAETVPAESEDEDSDDAG